MDEGLAVASRKAKPAGDKAFDPNGPIDASRALVPAVQRVNEQRVKRGFWPKVRRTATRIPFSRELLSAWFCARDPETPAAAKGMLLGALAYFVLPTDSIPDVFLGIGFTDDIAVLTAALAAVRAHMKPAHRLAAREALDDLS